MLFPEGTGWKKNHATGLYITSAIWFTSSTSIANPALTAARIFTSSPTGITVADALPFMAVQAAGAVVATAFFAWIDKE
jgi:glycerol uptake facilitator-like aquaporin